MPTPIFRWGQPTPENNSTPLRYALGCVNRPDVILLLLVNGANTDFPSHRNKSRFAILPDGSWFTKDISLEDNNNNSDGVDS